MNKNTLVAIIAGLVVVCVTALGIAFIVSGGTEDEPAPVATTEPAPTPAPSATPTSGGDEFILGLLEETWNKQSYSDQQSLCILFNYAPEEAWNAFDEGSEHLVPKDVFMEFFSGKCASIT
jgi:hypothetical protein